MTGLGGAISFLGDVALGGFTHRTYRREIGMILEDRVSQLEEALRKMEAQLSALGTLAIATEIVLDEYVPDFEQKRLEALDRMHRQQMADGEHRKAAVLNGLIQQLHQKLGASANDQ